MDAEDFIYDLILECLKHRCIPNSALKGIDNWRRVCKAWRACGGRGKEYWRELCLRRVGRWPE